MASGAGVAVAPVAAATPAGAPSPATQQQVPLARPVLVPVPPPATPPDADAPLAGYTDGGFYLRSSGNNFVLFPTGRLNFDGFFFLNRGDPPNGPPPGGPAGTSILPDSQADQRPRHTLFLRRARAELGGTLLKHFDFYISGEFATDTLFFQYATFTDVWVNVNYTPWANVMVGQFDAPFSLENRTPDKFIDFMERSLAVRALGVPTNKELGAMVYGTAPSRLFHYTLGVFNGDGPGVRNLDSQFDFIGRATFSPLALMRGAAATRWLTDLWVGGSIWVGQRRVSPYPVAPMSTQGAVTLMPPVFNIGTTTHFLSEDGDLLKWAVEVNAPVGPFGLRFELIRLQQDVGVFDKTFTVTDRQPLGHYERTGTAFYIQAWYWILGDYRILPTPGQQNPRRWTGYQPDNVPWKLALYVTAKYERLQLNLDDRGAAPASAELNQALVGGLTVDTAEVALNLWLTRHLRFSANYLMNYLDGDMKLIQGGYRFPPNGPFIQPTVPFYRTAEHELLFRVAVGL